MSDFSKKTGDYPSLSATDIRVLALTLALEREANKGSLEHLRTEPLVRRPHVDFYRPGERGGGSQGEGETKAAAAKLPGFYMPKEDEQGEGNDEVRKRLTCLESAFNRTSKKEESEESFSSFHYWRDPLPEVPSLEEPPEEKGDADPLDLAALDSYFSSRSYCVGFLPTEMDMRLLAMLSAQEEVDLLLPHLTRFLRHARSWFRGQGRAGGGVGSRWREATRKMEVMGKVLMRVLHIRLDGCCMRLLASRKRHSRTTRVSDYRSWNDDRAATHSTGLPLVHVHLASHVHY